MMSFDSTTKSARFPGVMDPNIFSLNDAHAGSRVIPGAKQRVSTASVLHIKRADDSTHLSMPLRA